MSNPLKGLYGRFRSYHDMDRPILEWIGTVGVVAFPFFYSLRYASHALALLYDDISLRAIAWLLCLGMATKTFWPRKLQKFYFAYSYVAVFYCLAFFLSFTMLKNHGGTAPAVNMVMGVVLIRLLADWRNTLIILLTGYLSSTTLYFLLDPGQAKIPTEFLISAAGSMLILIAGELSHRTEKQVEIKRMRHAAALAGSIAHEMRNPLGQIKYSLERLEHDLSPAREASTEQHLAPQVMDTVYGHLGRGQKAINRGMQIFSMILDEVSAKPLDATKFKYLSAAALTKNAVEEYSYATTDERDRVRLKIVKDFTFKVNETSYVFIVFNLVKNALYYFQAYPEATIFITVDRQLVTVRDTGPGIPSKRLADLFQSFNTSGKLEGTGLGLAYCKRVMGAFGGEITCDSAVGQYTQFSLRFPDIPETELAAYRQSGLTRARQTLQGKKILLVDDQPLLRATARTMLQDLGCDIDEAQDGRIAIDKLSQTAYDAILMDLKMPALDGYTATEKIRAGIVPEQGNVLIVAFTSAPAYVETIKIQKAGMNGFINKCCSQFELAEGLEHLFIEHTQGLSTESTDVLHGATVVVADDDEVNRHIVESYLRRKNVNVIGAGHGLAVLQMLKQCRDASIDAVILDMHMPAMGGLETAQAIRSQPSWYQNIPIVALTADVGTASMQDADAAGMNDFISKPVVATILFETLARQLSKRRAQTIKRVLFNGPITRQPEACGAQSPCTSRSPILEMARLEQFKRIDMLEDLGSYAQQIEQLPQRISQCLALQDFQKTVDTMHSLLGISGNAGAMALHRLLKPIYVALVDDGVFPTSTQWKNVCVCAGHSVQALRAYLDAEAATNDELDIQSLAGIQTTDALSLVGEFRSQPNI